MKIKNQYVQSFQHFLLSIKLKGMDSILRVRFTSLLGERVERLQDERRMIISDYAKKDENGKLVSTQSEAGAMYTLTKEGVTEMDKLMKEEFAIDYNEETSTMLELIKSIVLGYDEELSGQEAIDFAVFYDIVTGEKS